MIPTRASWEIQPADGGFNVSTTQGSIEANQPRPGEVLRLWDAVRRHLLPVVVFLVLGALVSTLYISLARPVYQAAASIRIDQKLAGTPVLDSFVRELTASDVFTEQAALGSRTLVEEVTDSLGLRLVMRKPVRLARSTVFSSVSVSRIAPRGRYRLQLKDPSTVVLTNLDNNRVVGKFAPWLLITWNGVQLTLAPGGVRHLPVDFRIDGFDETVARLGKALKVERPDRDANIIVLHAKDPDSALVRDIPNAIAANFIAKRRVVEKTAARSTVAFLRGQLESVKQQLAASEDSLGQFRKSQQVVDLTAESDSRVRHLADFEQQRNTLNAERVALQKIVSEVHEEVARNPTQSSYHRLVGFPTLFQNQAVSGLLQSLSEVENQRTALLSRRTMNDSDVRVLTQRINDIEHELDAIASTYLDGLTQQVASLDTTMRLYGIQLATIPARQIENTRLTRQPNLLENVYTLLQTRLRDAQVSEAVEDPAVRVLDPAIAPLRPYSPNPFLIIPGAILGSLCLGLLVAWRLEGRDATIHTRRHLLFASGLPVLAAIPSVRLSKRRQLLANRLGSSNDSNVLVNLTQWSPAFEAYRVLRTNLSVHQNLGKKAIGITSPLPGEGKTLTTVNLAATLAWQGLHVVIVDADMRRGVVSSLLKVPSEPGLSDVLSGRVDGESAIRTVTLGTDAQLDVVGAGSVTLNAAELLQGQAMQHFIALLRSRYDCVLVDTPPLNIVADGAILSPLLDGMLLVARAGMTTPDTVSYALEQLRMAGNANVLGTVLNDVDVGRDAHVYGSPVWSEYIRQGLVRSD